MDNQQERSTLSLEFLAGLIVGEGSYGIGIVRQTKFIELRPHFTLRMNDLETIDRLQESFAVYRLPLYRTPKLYAGCATVTVTGIKRLRQHLDVFLPLLTGKKAEAAQVVSDFIDRRLTEAFWRNYDETDIQAIERLREINGPNARRLSLEILRDYTRGTKPPTERKRGLAKR